jgi:hypothetical protein
MRVVLGGQQAGDGQRLRRRWQLPLRLDRFGQYFLSGFDRFGPIIRYGAPFPNFWASANSARRRLIAFQALTHSIAPPTAPQLEHQYVPVSSQTTKQVPDLES